jgi:hypothetical protein
MHTAPMALTRCSATSEAGAEFDGKYAKKRGCCQCVMPGAISRSKSAKTFSNGSGVSGGDGAIFAAISPGCTGGRTGRSRRRAR